MSKMKFSSRYLLPLARLNRAVSAGDEKQFEEALDDLVSKRESGVLADVQRLSDSLLAALARFNSDSRISALAAREIPDARLRLDHVLNMTEQAAHKTLDLIEATVPLANATAQKALELTSTLDDRSHKDIREFLSGTRTNIEAMRANLSEVMLTQGFQDLSGQILRSVQTLIGEVETVLGELARLTGARYEQQAAGPSIAPEGPAIPGITQNAVAGQNDVDDLIAGLGI